jgi:TPR repeat protein
VSARRIAGLLAAVALASPPLPVHAAEPTVAPAATTAQVDPAAAWEQVLATGDSETIYKAYDVLESVGYDGDGVDAAQCREHAAALSAAIVVAPVSLALRRAAYLCAQAGGDSGAAERAMTDLLALSRYALRDAGDYSLGRPMRVLAPADAIALVSSSGMQAAYMYYVQLRPRRFFPLVIAARDPDTGVERHLVFDFVDVAYTLDRKSKVAGFPILRNYWAGGYVRNAASRHAVHAVDAQAVVEAAAQSGERQLQTLRAGAAAGGVISARWWLVLCGREPSAHCADGLVDALLPQAEQKLAYPTLLLAVAHLEGIGVAADPASAWALLDGADRHWRQGEAIAEFSRIWQEIHARDDPMPAPLLQRLQQARVAGNRYPQRLLIDHKLAVKDKPVLDAEDIAFLSEPAENPLGSGFAKLADYYETIGDTAQMLKWMIKAAGAGSAGAQARYGYALYNGQYGLAKDEARARQVLANGAHGGAINAMGYLGYLAGLEGRWSDAENWQLAAIADNDQDALFDVADLYEHDRPGVNGKLDRAVAIYRSLDVEGSARARRKLATLAFDGRGMARDPQQALLWLRADADKDDATSQIQLAWVYFDGTAGKPDEAEGVRWMERALATGNENAPVTYAYWLYYRKASPAARERAFALWTQGDADGNTGARNGLAWALCTGPDAALDPARGLLVARRMGDPVDLSTAQLDTLAACQAAAGDFADGVATQQDAIERMVRLTAADTPAERERRLQDYRGRLALYQARKRYRDPAAVQSAASNPNSSVSLTTSPTK